MKKAIEMVEKFIEKGYQINDIIEISGLREEDVLQIESRMKKK
jgi:hypothetical protein